MPFALAGHVRRRCCQVARDPLFVAMAIVVILPFGSPKNLAASEAATSDSSPFALYVDPSNSSNYVSLDSMTLSDIPGDQPLGESEIWGRISSADGSTIVRCEGDRTIVVNDGRTGEVKLRFEVPEPVFLRHISRDGARLVTENTVLCEGAGCPAPVFRLYDARTGRLVTTIVGSVDEFFRPFVDADAQRLYEIIVNREGELEGSWPLRIVAHDLSNGVEIGSLTLPDFRYSQGPKRVLDQGIVSKTDVPAVALSPDGAWLAVVDAAASKLSMIDTASLTVAGTQSIHRTESALRRAARWIGLAPSAAEAKSTGGRQVSIVFSTDGRFLYLSGVVPDVDDSAGTIPAHGLGIMKIDVTSGEIVASALDNYFILDVEPAPDGRGIYVNGSAVVPWTVDHAVGFDLIRLDVKALSLLAERTFPGLIFFKVMSPLTQNP